MRRQTIILIISAVVAVTVIGSVARQYLNTRKSAMDTKSITGQLSDLMLLPDGEPKIATVVDADRLKQKDIFYKRAENGDKVVIWKERAVIYRPSIHKIVDFGIVVQ